MKRWAEFLTFNAGILDSWSLVCPMVSFSLAAKSISLLLKSFSRFSFQIKAFCQKLLGCAVLHLRISTIENCVLAKETVSMAHKQTHSLCFIHCYRWQSIFNGLLRLYLYRNSYGCKKNIFVKIALLKSEKETKHFFFIYCNKWDKKIWTLNGIIFPIQLIEPVHALLLFRTKFQLNEFRKRAKNKHGLKYCLNEFSRLSW